MEPIRIVVDGAPVGKGRPRFFIRRKAGTDWRSIGTSTPTKTVNYEALVRFEASEAMRGYPPYGGPVQVRITAMMPVPKSWSKRKKADALNGLIRPGKPDCDNILKIVSDALNSVVYVDDKQIAETRTSKLYDDDPRLEIEVEPLVDAPQASADRIERAAQGALW